MSIKLPVWPPECDKRHFDEVDSTLSAGMRLAGELTRPTWITAKRQTAACARRGRSWASLEGNLAATLILRVDAPPQELALRSFVAALALYDAVSWLIGDTAKLALKWPNDVLLNDRKLAGILLESTARAGGDAVLAIGIGVNLLLTPDVTQVEARAVRPTSIVQETGLSITSEAFLVPLAAAYQRHETTMRDQGFAPLRALWLARAARLGERITAQTGSAKRDGIFDTIDLNGNLLLQTPEGKEKIAAADIYF